jgi:hypothetical protein
MTFIHKNIPLEHKDPIINLLKEYVDYFAWNCCEMSGHSQSW